MSWRGEQGIEKSVKKMDEMQMIVYSNHSHNDWVLLIVDSILSQSIGEGKGDRNLMAKLELLNGGEYDNIFKLWSRRFLSVTSNIQNSFL